MIIILLQLYPRSGSDILTGRRVLRAGEQAFTLSHLFSPA